MMRWSRFDFTFRSTSNRFVRHRSQNRCDQRQCEYFFVKYKKLDFECQTHMFETCDFESCYRFRQNHNIKHSKYDFTSQSSLTIHIISQKTWVEKIKQLDLVVVIVACKNHHVRQLNFTVAARIRKINAERRFFKLVTITSITNAERIQSC